MASPENQIKKLLQLDFYKAKNKWKLAPREFNFKDLSICEPEPLVATSKEDCVDSKSDIKPDEDPEADSVNVTDSDYKPQPEIQETENVGKVARRLSKLYELAQMVEKEDCNNNKEKPVQTREIEVNIGELILTEKRQDNNHKPILTRKRNGSIDESILTGKAKDRIDGHILTGQRHGSVNSSKLIGKRQGVSFEDAIHNGERIEKSIQNGKKHVHFDKSLVIEKRQDTINDFVLKNLQKLACDEPCTVSDKDIEETCDLEWNIPIHSQLVDDHQCEENKEVIVPNAAFWKQQTNVITHSRNNPPPQNATNDSIQYWVNCHMQKNRSLDSEGNFMREVQHRPHSSENELSQDLDEDDSPTMLASLSFQQLADQICEHTVALHTLLDECSRRTGEINHNSNGSSY